MASIPTKRTRTLIDSEVQGSLIRRVAIHWIVFFVCNTVALTLWIQLFELPDSPWDESAAEMLRRFFPFFIITAALIPAFVWDTLKLSHRFAGPITRLRSTLVELREGRAVSPLRFRESDFWQEIATNFNEVMRLGETDEVVESQAPEDAASNA